MFAGSSLPPRFGSCSVLCCVSCVCVCVCVLCVCCVCVCCVCELCVVCEFLIRLRFWLLFCVVLALDLYNTLAPVQYNTHLTRSLWASFCPRHVCHASLHVARACKRASRVGPKP
jgi:hypothetical protein